MAVTGKLELTLKITEFPTDVQTVENNWKQFTVDCDGRIFTITVKPKMFKKLEEAQANYPLWVAAIAGKLGEATPDGFVLADPAIQVFEKKPKDPKETAPKQKGLSSNRTETYAKAKINYNKGFRS